MKDLSEVQENLISRRSVFRFIDKEVANNCVEIAFEAARFAPCHKQTHPWKFYVMGPETRNAIIPTVEHLAKEKIIDSEEMISDQLIERAKKKITSPPVLIAVTSKLTPGNSFREEEDYAATVCALHNLVLSLWDQGIGSQWSTGSITRHADTYKALGISDSEERIIGLIKAGYPDVIPNRNKKAKSEIRFFLP